MGIQASKLGGPSLNILSYNPGHDGAIVHIKDGRLMFSIESEKDSHYRYSALSIPHVLGRYWRGWGITQCYLHRRLVASRSS